MRSVAEAPIGYGARRQEHYDTRRLTTSERNHASACCLGRKEKGEGDRGARPPGAHTIQVAQALRLLSPFCSLLSILARCAGQNRDTVSQKRTTVGVTGAVSASAATPSNQRPAARVFLRDAGAGISTGPNEGIEGCVVFLQFEVSRARELHDSGGSHPGFGLGWRHLCRNGRQRGASPTAALRRAGSTRRCLAQFFQNHRDAFGSAVQCDLLRAARICAVPRRYRRVRDGRRERRRRQRAGASLDRTDHSERAHLARRRSAHRPSDWRVGRSARAAAGRVDQRKSLARKVQCRSRRLGPHNQDRMASRTKSLA